MGEDEQNQLILLCRKAAQILSFTGDKLVHLCLLSCS